MEETLEEMGKFFDARIDTYEEHMLTEVVGGGEIYHEIVKYIPVKAELKLVDLGCGTGLELEEIFQKNPNMKVTGIDLSTEMLARLKSKFKEKNIIVHQMSYFDFDYGSEQYETAVSCMTLHHSSHEDKLDLYRKVCKGLVPGGRYVECDYMASSQEEEDFYYSENKKLRNEQGIKDGFYHYDTPCTIENQIKLLLQAGFSKVDKVWQQESTVILQCIK